MIITRTPFRVSFAGGGSDIASFYEENGGCVLSTSINYYMYISIHPYFQKDIRVLKYSKTEVVRHLHEISHPIFRCALTRYPTDGIEISSTADVPAGTGLGSSSSFAVGLLHALHAYHNHFVSKRELAEEACDIEIGDLGAPIGKQDQYAAAFGGLNFFRFHRDGHVSVEPLVMSGAHKKTLESRLMLFYTGAVRDANTILEEQSRNIATNAEKTQALREMCVLAERMRDVLQQGAFEEFGNLMDENWRLKRSLQTTISNADIDKWYRIARENGATGGKLLGAGGGGFLLFDCDPALQNRVRAAMPLQSHRFAFDQTGSSVIFVGE